jgi:hypothetical protein
VLQPFPEVDLVDFFNSHTKLRKFEIHGAMFAALCQRNSLKNVSGLSCLLLCCSIVPKICMILIPVICQCSWIQDSPSLAWKRF